MYFAHDKSITNLGKNHICLYVGSFDPPHIGHQNMVTHLNNLCLFDLIKAFDTIRLHSIKVFFKAVKLMTRLGCIFQGRF